MALCVNGSADVQGLAGDYVGRSRIRAGRECDLTIAEKKRFAKATEEHCLELRDDGTFTHKGSTVGRFSVEGERLRFHPLSFSGKTLETYVRTANEEGRAFGLAWLFNPFELKVVGDALVTPDERAAIFVEYVRR